MNELTVGIISVFLILAGAVGSVLPILPGPPLAFGGLLLYAWYTDFENIGPWILIIFGALTALTFVVDFMAPALGARGYKASRYGMIGAMVGAFGGIFLIGPLGILLGPLAGAFIGEFLHVRNAEHASRIAWGAFVGFLVGSFFKLAVILGMLIYLLIAWL